MSSSKPPELFSGWDESLFGPAPGTPAADGAVAGPTPSTTNAPIAGPAAAFAALLGKTRTARLARDARLPDEALPAPPALLAGSGPPARSVAALLEPHAAFVTALPAEWLAAQIEAAIVHDDALLTAADQSQPEPARDVGDDTEALLQWAATVVPDLVRASQSEDWATLADQAEAGLRVALAWAPAAMAWRWTTPGGRAIQGVALGSAQFPMAPDVDLGSFSLSVWFARQRARALLALAARAAQQGQAEYAARLSAQLLGASDVIFEGDPVSLNLAAVSVLPWPAAWYLFHETGSGQTAPSPRWTLFPHAIARGLNRLWDEEHKHVLPGEELSASSIAAAVLVVHTAVERGGELDAAEGVGRGWRHPEFDTLWRMSLDLDTQADGLLAIVEDQSGRGVEGTWSQVAGDPLYARLMLEATGTPTPAASRRAGTGTAPAGGASIWIAIAAIVVAVLSAVIMWLVAAAPN